MASIKRASAARGIGLALLGIALFVFLIARFGRLDGGGREPAASSLSMQWNVQDGRLERHADGRLIVYVRDRMDRRYRQAHLDAMRNWNGQWDEQSGRLLRAGAVLWREWTPGKPRMVECFNDDYGDTGWLGLARVRIRSGFIVAAQTRLNEYAPYKISSRQVRSVQCHELGHTVGLQHTDEDWATNRKSCMDYSTAYWQVPHSRDFDILDRFYLPAAAADTTTRASNASSLHDAFDDNGHFGHPIQQQRHDGLRHQSPRSAHHLTKTLDDGDTVLTMMMLINNH